MIGFTKESKKHFDTKHLNCKNYLFSEIRIVLFIFFLVIGCNQLLDAQEIERVVPKSTTITLTWTATGDDGSIGQSSFYDIRYSLTPITDDNWKSAKKTNYVSTPKFNGSAESFQAMSLIPNTNYYFAIKVGDESDNWSEMSNVAIFTTAPPPICGDLDESGTIDITDLVLLVTYMFKDSLPKFNLKAADVDSSGGIDVSDLILFVTYMFGDEITLDCP